ncbi:MAG: DUF3566 domain-containing protein [Bifidobacteriaceae bacterium]|jgi:hypothetical protein|nr:DUF3566 domain-containing protein [Bifidobacteriaceae bacterium]
MTNKASQPKSFKPKAGSNKKIDSDLSNQINLNSSLNSNSNYNPNSKDSEVTIKAINPNSALRIGFILSIALGIIFVVTTSVLWIILNSVSFFTHILSFISASGIGDSNFDLDTFISFPKILALSIIVAVINVAVFTLLSFLFAHIYNISAKLVGGLKGTIDTVI